MPGIKLDFFSITDAPALYSGFIDENVDLFKKDKDFFADIKAVSEDNIATDGRMIPIIEHEIDEITKTNNKYFFVIETYSAHWPYADRYDYSSTFEKFTPSFDKDAMQSFDDSMRELIINSYDNAILYFDDFVNSIFSKIKSGNVILIITSDHGQSLGEQNIWGHCSGQREQMLVPLILISSNELVFKKFLGQALYNHDYPISHANIFSTILGFLGYDPNTLEFTYHYPLHDIVKEKHQYRHSLLSPLDPPDKKDIFAVFDHNKNIIDIKTFNW